MTHDTDEITVADIVKRYGVTAECEVTSPPREPLPRTATHTRHGAKPYRCNNCESRFNVETGAGLKARRYPNLGHECAGCGAYVLAEASTAYRITLRADGCPNGIIVPSYTRGSYYMFKPDPTAEDVLDALKSDASLWENALDADDFIREFGGIEDADDPLTAVRKAEESYRECGETFKRLGYLLGDAGRAELMNAEGL